MDEFFQLKHSCSKASDGRKSLFAWDRKTPRFEKTAQKSIFAPRVIKHRSVLLIRKSSGDKSSGRGILEHRGSSIEPQFYFRDRICHIFHQGRENVGMDPK